jgi:hypothetical protein
MMDVEFWIEEEESGHGGRGNCGLGGQSGQEYFLKYFVIDGTVEGTVLILNSYQAAATLMRVISSDKSDST